MNKVLLNFAKRLGVVFVLSVLLPLPFLALKYDGVLIGLFAVSNLLIWTDGFLTIYALRIGGKKHPQLEKQIEKVLNKFLEDASERTIQQMRDLEEEMIGYG